ncbi:hypothetical protein DFS34DRAFT_676757 [Phlyctochytrium arcticum]|nr:hypothetical protein DFS34DRAFT_676757 [Phlyctochytrium arcticum]
MADPITRVWYQLRNEKGEELGTPASIRRTAEIQIVDDLRKEVKKECPRHLADYDPVDLKVYANEAALDADIAANKNLEGLKPGTKVGTLQTDDDNPLLIVVPPPPVSPLSSLSPLSSEERHLSKNRKRRWDALNKIINKNKKVKENPDGTLTTGYSYVSWNDVEEVFEDGMEHMILDPKPVSDKALDWLYQTLCINTDAFGGVASEKEAKRLYFIAPILAFWLKKLRMERIYTLVEARQKKVCIVQAKKDDFEQGQAQDLLGCEALADVENLNCVYGIVTNYLVWYFLKSRDDNIERNISTLGIDPTGLYPERISVSKIVGKVCTLLSE